MGIVRQLGKALLLLAAAGACTGRAGYEARRPGDRSSDSDETPCIPESDTALCAMAGLACGDHATVDRCGQARVAACGGCPFPDSCGGAGSAGQCGHRPWFGLSGSDFGDWTTPMTWGVGAGGGLSSNAGESTAPALALASGTSPVVAWLDLDLGITQVYLRQWNGTDWQELAGSATGGGISQEADEAWAPALAVDSTGNPVVAWQHWTSTTSDVYLRRWDGATWVELGGSATAGGISASTAGVAYVALALDTLDRPLVAWRDGSSYEIYLRRWDDTVWLELNGSATGGGISNTATTVSEPSLASTPSGDPVVTWTTTVSSIPQIYLKTWNGSAWQGLASSDAGNGVSNTAAAASASSLAAAADGTLVVAWAQTVVTTTTAQQIFLRRFNGTTWEELAGSASGTGISTSGLCASPSVALDAAGHPTVAWADSVSGVWQIFLLRWNGSAWGLTGSATGDGVSGTAGTSTSPIVAVDTLGNPVVVWSEATIGNSEIYLRRWNGAWWDAPGGTAKGGGISADRGNSGEPSLRLVAGEHPVVAWADGTNGNGEIYVRELEGGTWAELGAGSASAGGISDNAGWSVTPALAADAAGHVVVAWDDDSGGNNAIYVRGFDGTSWVELGAGSASGSGMSASTGWVAEPALVLDSTGNPVVAWADSASTLQQIYVRRFDGTSWMELGAGSASGGGVSQNTDRADMPALVLDSADRPIVAWVGYSNPQPEIYLRRYDGAGWVELGAGSASGGGVSNTATESLAPALALDGNGNPVLAWRETTTTGYAVYVRRYDGTGWIEVGAGSASAGGVSSTAAIDRGPSLAVTTTDHPVVAWTSCSSGNCEIDVRRFDGSAWGELAGSATAGGVSNSAAGSAAPSLATAAGLLCVAWSETGYASSEILLRCTQQD